jgi:hypothetical protein
MVVKQKKERAKNVLVCGRLSFCNSCMTQSSENQVKCVTCLYSRGTASLLASAAVYTVTASRGGSLLLTASYPTFFCQGKQHMQRNYVGTSAWISMLLSRYSALVRYCRKTAVQWNRK